jgi:uncharacterized protein (TIGR02246 family)
MACGVDDQWKLDQLTGLAEFDRDALNAALETELPDLLSRGTVDVAASVSVRAVDTTCGERRGRVRAQIFPQLELIGSHNHSEETYMSVEAIEETRKAHVAALNRGDVDAWASAFADDGVQMPPNAPANVGRDSIRAWSGGLLSAFSVEFALAPEEVQVAGDDWAFERGDFEIALTPKGGGEPMRDAGKYITVYQQQPDGRWAMARDIWNSDNPLPGMPQ